MLLAISAAADTDYYVKRDTWAETMVATRQEVVDFVVGRNADKQSSDRLAGLASRFWQDFPTEMDWLMQDNREYRRNPHESWQDLREYLDVERDVALEQRAIRRVIDQIGDGADDLAGELATLADPATAVAHVQWLRLYVRACMLRRERRLAGLMRHSPAIAFIKRHPVRPSFFGYTEGQSDAQAESHFNPGSALCLLEMDGINGTVTTLAEDRTGVFRDLDVSYDGERLLYAYKRSHREDDYHLYEMTLADRSVRQITSGKGVADFEGRYLPDGDVIFSSSRCVQTVDCWWTEVSNIYRCAPDGRFLRRLGFDQVHTVHPAVLDDGRVVYTRWDYNDRGQIFPQSLFQMNSDGTSQTEFYGNNSWFPTTTSHVRGIPGTVKVVAVLMGHHSWQAGKLAIIDRSLGTQEASGVQLVAPVRDTKAVRVDGYGQDEELFRHPYALNEREFITAMSHDPRSRHNGTRFKLYWIDLDGNRELLAADPDVSCDHPVPVTRRRTPRVHPSTVDYRKETGMYYVQDVYAGPGLAGVERGTIEKLRVVALEFRAAGVGSNGNGGEAGGAMVSTPISIGCGAWDVKKVLGEATVYDDGSAFLTVPARVPVYFQAVDRNGHVAQTMRSWSTLMPGETFSCVGCHEDKSATPLPRSGITQAMAAGPEGLKPFYGPPRGFSFLREVQPILDKHCIRCHTGGEPGGEIQVRASHCLGEITAPIDGSVPKNSNDHDIPRFTWWPQKGTSEWFEIAFEKRIDVSEMSVYWFDDAPRGGGCRLPLFWHIEYRDVDEWHEVRSPSRYEATTNEFNRVTFDRVTTNGLRIVVELEPGFSGGILECHTPSLEPVKQSPFSLRISPAYKDPSAKRLWAASYMGLTGAPRKPNSRADSNRELLNWVDAQSRPSMLPPYHKGSAKSKLIAMLRDGHGKTTLSREELDKISAWIDLGVPYCGDYLEAGTWTAGDVDKYIRYQRKREKLATEERRDLEAYVQHTTGEKVSIADPAPRYAEYLTDAARDARTPLAPAHEPQ